MIICLSLLIFINLTAWLTYDIYGKAYVTVVTDTCSLISTIAGIIRHDLPKKRSEEK